MSDTLTVYALKHMIGRDIENALVAAVSSDLRDIVGVILEHDPSARIAFFTNGEPWNDEAGFHVQCGRHAFAVSEWEVQFNKWDALIAGRDALAERLRDAEQLIYEMDSAL